MSTNDKTGGTVEVINTLVRSMKSNLPARLSDDGEDFIAASFQQISDRVAKSRRG